MGKDDLKHIKCIEQALNVLQHIEDEEHNEGLYTNLIEYNVGEYDPTTGEEDYAGVKLSHLRRVISNLKSIKQEWRDEFIKKTLDLESRSLLTPHDAYFYSLLKEMHSLNQQILDDYLQTPDLSISMHADALDDEWLMCPYCVDAWESTSKDAMVLCPMCLKTSHNPRFTTQ